MTCRCTRRVAHWQQLTQYLNVWATPVILLGMRIYVGLSFWRSGLTKWADMDNTRDLFADEYLPHWADNSRITILGVDITFPVPSAEFAAVSATGVELIGAALLMIGLGGRFAAGALFAVAAVIELFIYPGMAEHHYWLFILALFMAAGSGTLSIDHLIRQKQCAGIATTPKGAPTCQT